MTVEEGDVSQESPGGAGWQELAEGAPRVRQQFRGTTQSGKRITQHDKNQGSDTDADALQEALQAEDEKAGRTDSEHRSERIAEVVSLKGSNAIQNADEGESTENREPACRGQSLPGSADE